ncbi:MAG TPA: twin-arginine translocase TatA/TatE family subunit [Thermoleophilia bacterium]|nr:twin-arginine translocase TatA/TatE family subunit [Thermoleophilia bacterium]
MPNIGWPEIVIVLVILLVIFGPKRLPHLGKSIGQSVRGFKRGIKGEDEEGENEQVEAPAAQLTPAQANVPAQPVAQQPAQVAAQPVQPEQVAPPVAATQTVPEPVPVAPQPPATLPQAAEAPEPGERSTTQV